MKFINIQTGVILEPKSEMVVDQLHKSPDYKLAAAQAAGVEVPEGATNPQIIELIQASGNV